MAEEKLTQYELSKDIIYGVEQTVACLGTDPIVGPLVDNKVQQGLMRSLIRRKLTDITTNKDHKKETMLGEATGDFAALATFIGLQRYLPQLARAIKNATKYIAGGLYEKIGRAELRSWAAKHDVAEDSKEFRDKVEEYKDTQANNFARSGIITVGSIGYNVFAQKKLFKNDNPWQVVLAGKVTSGLLTMVGVVAARAAFPRFFHRSDEYILKKGIEPVVRGTQKLFGVTDAELAPQGADTAKPAAPAKPALYADKLIQQRATRNQAADHESASRA